MTSSPGDERRSSMMGCRNSTSFAAADSDSSLGMFVAVRMIQSWTWAVSSSLMPRAAPMVCAGKRAQSAM